MIADNQHFPAAPASVPHAQANGQAMPESGQPALGSGAAFDRRPTTLGSGPAALDTCPTTLESGVALDRRPTTLGSGAPSPESGPAALECGPAALDELYWRAEILQAMYWMRGEGLADAADAPSLATFLVAEEATIATHLALLATQGYLEPLDAAISHQPSAVSRQPSVAPQHSALSTQHSALDSALSTRRYRLTPQGVAEGGRSFRDEFADLTRAAHYECSPGCWCHDPERADEPCPTHPERPTAPAPSPGEPGHGA